VGDHWERFFSSEMETSLFLEALTLFATSFFLTFLWAEELRLQDWWFFLFCSIPFFLLPQFCSRDKQETFCLDLIFYSVFFRDEPEICVGGHMDKKMEG
jgi:hypothetical protein